MITRVPAHHVITIGNFDGVHLGHRAIIQRCVQFATDITASSHHPRPAVAVVTFDQPPIAVLRPGQEPPQIDDREGHRQLLLQAGADTVEYLQADADLLDQSAESFIERLAERFSPSAIIEGPDFRFGQGRQGDHALLEKLGQKLGFQAVRMDRETAVLTNRQVVPVSSSLIRWLIGRGRVEDASRCLGRPFMLAAPVVKGEQRGRTIGIPTANLDPAALQNRIIPADGVYAAQAVLDDGRVFPAAVSIGNKPTFGKSQLTVEAHLTGFDGDLYGHLLGLRFARWLRDQYPFPSLESLRRQLQQDVQDAEQTATPSVSATP